MLRLSTRPLRHMKRERKLIKKEKDFYIDPENGRERNETKKKRGRGVTGTRKAETRRYFCTSHTQFTATEEIRERNKATRFQNQSGRKTELVLRLKSYSRGLIRLNHENGKEGIAQCVE